MGTNIQLLRPRTLLHVQAARKTEITHCAMTFEAETKNSRANQLEVERILSSLLYSHLLRNRLHLQNLHLQILHLVLCNTYLQQSSK